ncbi:MAG: EamA family transporter [Nitrosarchaeum sp.]|nr:EamA family transporter [Nitrosarchaeum sp.]
MIIPIMATLLAAFLAAFAQISFKRSSNCKKTKEFTTWLLSGFILYAVSTLIYILSLKYERLVLLYPVVATSYIWTCVLGSRFLNERLSWQKLLGVLMIFLGVALSF